MPCYTASISRSGANSPSRNEPQQPNKRLKLAEARAVRRTPNTYRSCLVPVSSSFRTFVIDQLSRVIPRVRARSMFGGVGIYASDRFFALIADDTLYLKVDESNRPDFEARSMGPFRPYAEHGEVIQYYEVPADLLDDPEALRPWAEKAIAVAGRKKGKR